MDTDFTLKELFLNIQEYVRFLFKKKIWLVFTIIICAALYTLWQTIKPIEYDATLTFMLNEDERGGAAALSGILGQMGFGIRSGEANLDKIVELSRARQISQDALFKKSYHQ